MLTSNCSCHSAELDHTRTGFSKSNCTYSNSCEQVGGFIIGVEDWVERAPSAILASGQQAVAAVLGKGEADIFSKAGLSGTINVTERNIEGRHDPGFELGLRHQIIFGVIKFQVDYLVDRLRVLLSKVVQLVE